MAMMTPTMIAPRIESTTPSTTFLFSSFLFPDGWLVPVGVLAEVTIVGVIVVDVMVILVDIVMVIEEFMFVLLVSGIIDVVGITVVVGIGGGIQNPELLISKYYKTSEYVMLCTITIN